MSDETGSMETSLVAEGSLSKDLLDPSDVFLVDTGKELFVWIGGGASPDEKKNAMTYAHVRWCCLHSDLTSNFLDPFRTT